MTERWGPHERWDHYLDELGRQLAAPAWHPQPGELVEVNYHDSWVPARVIGTRPPYTYMVRLTRIRSVFGGQHEVHYDDMRPVDAVTALGNLADPVSPLEKVATAAFKRWNKLFGRR
jgi:hypothetical protein